jgi:mono/diheme cytochrome c family protein
MKLLLAGLVVVVMGCAILGIGMGEAPAEREQTPSDQQVTAAKQRLANSSAEVKRGRVLFEDEGCDRCHSIAAIGADGKLGPRLDTLDEDLDDNRESIAEPRDDTTDGYPEKLMPTTFDDRLSDADLQALATFVTTVSGGDEGEQEGGNDDGDEDGGGGKGRGRNRGRGGSGSG